MEREGDGLAKLKYSGELSYTHELIMTVISRPHHFKTGCTMTCEPWGAHPDMLMNTVLILLVDLLVTGNCNDIGIWR
jgi:hypothetical protein